MRRSLLGWYGPDRRPWTETLLLLGVLALTAEEALYQWMHSDGPLRLPRAAVVALASLSLLFIRRHPVASAVLPVLTGGLFNRAYPGLLSVFHLAHLGRTGPAMVCGTVIAVVSATRAHSLVGWAGTTGSQLLLQAATLAVGLWLHGRRVLIRTLHEQVDALRRERELRAEQVRAAERARIAREMHDVLAHRLSLLVLHAGVLRDQARAGTVAADPDRLTHRLELLRTTAARSLDDLRDVLGALRADSPVRPAEGSEPFVPADATDATDATDAAGAARVPAPALRDLTELVGEATQAGQQVELALSGDPETVPTTHRLAVHRVVQEALTNARKHAHAAPVTVRVGYGEPATTVDIRNGPGEAPPDGPGSGGGYGLVGLAERVGALGGHLDAGPDGGGFRLSARLPAPDRPPQAAPDPASAQGGGPAAQSGAQQSQEGEQGAQGVRMPKQSKQMKQESKPSRQPDQRPKDAS
ncbi:sensor histidine kinase [Kitasatospora brasiliensis]|uniref:sensor histidine kinase n=1 Tax=Kitasatospora brasiliensis TaxID=3058040 RepID=UPI0029314E89|nr:histidine kinase [Kitasatospora sp. K002]